MTTEIALSVTELRRAAFDLLEATADENSLSGSAVSAAIEHLQTVANELGMVEELLRHADRPPAPSAEELRRHFYGAR
jgi:hypothetical protein